MSMGEKLFMLAAMPFIIVDMLLFPSAVYHTYPPSFWKTNLPIYERYALWISAKPS